MGVSLPKTPLFIATQSSWIGADLNDFILTWASKKEFPYQVTFTGMGEVKAFSWEFGGNIIQPMTVSLPLPAIPTSLLAQGTWLPPREPSSLLLGASGRGPRPTWLLDVGLVLG